MITVNWTESYHVISMERRWKGCITCTHLRHGETNHLYSAAVERVFYRQIVRALICAHGMDPSSVCMFDNFASKCFLWVRTFPSPAWRENPTEEDVEIAIREKAALFGVPLGCIEIHDEPYQLPAYVKSTLNTPSMNFDQALQRIAASYARYIRYDPDTSSVEALRIISDVATCAHLTYSSPKMQFAFVDLHLGDLNRDKNLGLFECTGRVADQLVACELARPGRTLTKGKPKYLTAQTMLDAFGVSVDFDLSTSSLRGVADVVIGTTILDVKCSSERSGVQAPWVLQLLVYAALARIRGLEVDRIAIYNPVQGFLWEAPIGDWGRHEDLLRRVNADMSGVTLFES
jgi:hypothetical protein